GIQITELFPRTARLAHRFSLIRTLHHPDTVTHDVGRQIVQTGYWEAGGLKPPHPAAALSRIQKPFGDFPPHIVLQGSSGCTPGCQFQKQSLVTVGETTEAFFAGTKPAGESPATSIHEGLSLAGESDNTRRKYGANPFGRSCLTARKLIEHGVGFVTV